MKGEVVDAVVVNIFVLYLSNLPSDLLHLTTDLPGTTYRFSGLKPFPFYEIFC